MAISLTRYVQITSGVGAGSSIGTRQLILRLFTDNAMLPPQTNMDFGNLASVGAYFGYSSAEYLRASFYFSFVSKNIVTPPSISFARWVDTAVGSQIYGLAGSYMVSQFSGITNGGFTLQLGGFTTTLTAINTSAAGSLAAVATIIQTAIRAVTGNGAAWTGATVSYDPTRGAFNLVSGTTGNDVISVTAATSGTDLAAPLGWVTGAIFANGSAIETLTATLTNSSGRSNNFGSFAFMPTLSLAQHTEAANWNKAQNVFYQYMVPVTASNASTWSAGLIQIGGTALTLSPLSTEYPELIPAVVLAATDYTKRNATQNYMYQNSFPCTPSVTTDALANIYDALRVNYYGQSQSAGQLITFYQRGILCGLQTDPVDMNTYANEQWLKNDAATGFINLLLSLAKVSANAQGTSQCLAILRTTIDRAVRNGTISTNKDLSAIEKAYITNLTGDPMAFLQVQSLGYYYSAAPQSYVNTNTGLTEYKLVYTLIYAKDDVIRAVNGTHILI